MKRRKPIIIINIVFLVLEVIGAILSFTENGWGLFRYFTDDSNYFATVSSIILLVFLLQNKEIPKWFVKMRYVAVLLLALTFVITACVLAPMRGAAYFSLFTEGSKLYQHTFCPILFFISYFGLERKVPKEKKCIFCGMLPTIVYGVILVVLNLLRVVDGPYAFLRVRNQPIYMSAFWLVAIFDVDYLMALGLWKLGRLAQHASKKMA